MIRILLVDDQNIVRQGIQALLEPRPKLKIVGTAEDGNSAIEQVGAFMPDIVLMDIEMPGMSGITATQKICQQFPKTKVLVLSSHKDREYVTQALQAGAEGYLLKNTLAEDLEQAIWSVYQGRSQIESKLLKEIFTQTATPFSQLIARAEPNRSTAIEKQSLQETSSNLYSDTNKVFGSNNKHLQKNGENTEISLNRSSSKISKTTLEAISEQSESEAKKSPNSKSRKREKSEIDDSPNEQVSKESFVRQDLTEREQKPQQKKVISLKLLKWWIRILVVVPIILITAITMVRFLSRPKPQPSSASAPAQTKLPEIKKVAALGRIEPLGEVMSLSAPTSLEAVQVEQLLVQVGDRVKKAQIIAILDGRQRQQAALDEAKTQSEVAQSRLEKVKAGAKQGAIGSRQAAIANLEAELAGEIQTQQATIAKLVAELDNARTEWQRNQQLFNEGAISASELDSKKLTLETSRERLNEARATFERTQRTLNARLAEAQATLEETAEVRPVDVQIAQAELKQAQAAVAKAEADLELAYVRAPVDGEILDIHTRPGEALSEKGIAEIGQTEQMMVVAEIDQNDIDRVKIGQRAAITSGVFPDELHGKVHQVGSLINKNDILDTDPAADEDSRVVEVEILLKPEDSRKVAKLTNLEVDVVIEL
ncbi:MAG: response regulator [Xenococcaceae cyanobacterium MO_188.B32]|nr:response regulator [Xenococcaceae cyanobacterium MO_188.B32]